VKFFVKGFACREALMEFAEKFNQEYAGEIKRMRYFMFRKFLPLMTMEIHDCPDGCVVYLPVTVPELNQMRQLMKKLSGKEMEPRWKEKLAGNIMGFLAEKGIKADVMYVG
jgi:hypothetical protein